MLSLRKVLSLLALAAGLAIAGNASAQVYPTRPIAMIVPVPPGGVLDPVARILAERMRVSLGQPIVVENIPGAGGSIGVDRVARSNPDGYTLSIGNWLTHVGASATHPVRYDVLTAFAPVSLLTHSPFWLVSRKNFPATNLGELIAWLKSNPDKALAGTVGPASAAHLCAVYFQQRTGTRFQLIPFRGGGPAIQNVITGHVDFMFGDVATSVAYLRSGQIRAFSVLAKSRSFAAPNVQTVDELDLPGLHFSFWQALWVPRGTPREIVAKLNAAVVEAINDPVTRQRITGLGHEVFPRDQLTPETLGSFHKAETEKWWPIIRAANIAAK